MVMRFFDFEVTPNWWCCVIGDLPVNELSELSESVKESFQVVTSDDYDARGKLVALIREPGYVWTGYNIKGYDLPIANGVYQGFTAPQIKLLSDLIIAPPKDGWTSEHYRLQPFVKRKLNGVVYQDLLDDNDGTLKEKEAILGLSIIESEVSFDKAVLTEGDKEDLVYYCKHDVYACMYFYLAVMKGYVENKLLIAKKFGIDEATAYKCTNAKLVAKALGAVRTSFDDKEKIAIDLPDKIQDYCYDNLPPKIINVVRNSIEGVSVKLFDNYVDFSNGGLHSVLSNNLYVESNDEYTLINVDAASYYGSMLIQFDCLSRAVRNPKVFSEIFNERIRLKHKPDKTPDEEDSQLANKLVINTTFGASGNKWLDLYDPHMCTRCCRLGQIFLAALANKLHSKVPGIKIVQTNTDGILIYVRRKDVDSVKKYADEWTNVSGIVMELEEADKIWQRDVNNYLLVKKGGKIKRKGTWLMETWTKPGYFLISPLTAFVCAKAAINWLVYGDDIVKSIVSNKNLQDFAITCKKGPSFRHVVRRNEDGSETMLFKCNRVYASKDRSLGQIYKIKYRLGTPSYHKMPNIPDNCQLLNLDLSTYNFDELRKDLDYMYYVNRAADLVDIDWRTIEDGRLVPGPNFKYND